jgi:hypothetical protein
MLSPITEREGTDPRYRAILVDMNGGPVQVLSLTAPNDDKALTQARALVDGHGVDLWDGIHFIEHFQAVGPPK